MRRYPGVAFALSSSDLAKMTATLAGGSDMMEIVFRCIAVRGRLIGHLTPFKSMFWEKW